MADEGGGLLEVTLCRAALLLGPLCVCVWGGGAGAETDG